MPALFACTVYGKKRGKKVFSKELEWFQTVSVFIFTAKSAHFKQFLFLWGREGCAPPSGRTGNRAFLDVLISSVALSGASMHCGRPTLQLRRVFESPHYCWQRQKREGCGTGAELVQRCPRATHITQAEHDLPLGSPRLVRINNTIALLQKEKIKNAPRRVRTTSSQNQSLCFLPELRNLWRASPRRRFLFKPPPVCVCVFVVGSSARVLTWSRMS